MPSPMACQAGRRRLVRGAGRPRIAANSSVATTRPTTSTAKHQRDARVRQQEPADRRTGQQPDLHPEGARGVRGDDLVVPDGPRQQRLAGRALHAREGGQQERQDVERPDRRPLLEGVDGEERGDDGLRDTRDDEQPAAVDVVGERAAVQPADEERDELDEPDEADGGVGAGERVELVGDRDVADHPAEVEHGPGGEEQPEVAGGPQRRGVHAHGADPVQPAHRRSIHVGQGAPPPDFAGTASTRLVPDGQVGCPEPRKGPCWASARAGTLGLSVAGVRRARGTWGGCT